MSEPDFSPPALRRFLKELIVPNLGNGFQFKGKREAVRMRGPFVQSIALARARGSGLYVIPYYFMVGADPTSEVMHENLGLAILNWRNWSFLEAKLDSEFAALLLTRLRADAPASFFDDLTDTSIDAAMQWFIRKGNDPSAHQFKTFMAILLGRETARTDLERAIAVFKRKALSDPPRDHEAALLQRYADLEARLGHPDCIALCRADAEAHAQRLKLPPIAWPHEWPTSVPPWPKRRKALLDRFRL